MKQQHACLRIVHRGHVAGQVDEPVAVPPLVIIPRDELDEVVIQLPHKYQTPILQIVICYNEKEHPQILGS